MTRVMHVLAPSPVGGLERVVQTLAIAQRTESRAADVHVVTLSNAPVRDLEPFIAPLRLAGVQVHTVVTPVRAYARQREELLALTENLQPDIVHTHGAHADVLAARLGARTSAAMVSTLHGIVGGDLRNQAYEWLQRRTCRERDAVVSVSRPLARQLIDQGFAPERMHVVRNAWSPGATALTRTEARRSLGLPQYGFIVGWVGRLSHEKGLDILIDALAAFPTLDVHLSVIGDGRERAALTRRATKTELARQRRIYWHGQILEAGRLLAAFDVLVISSRTEGTPMLLFEAMATGVPIITAAVGGIPDVVNSTEALLVPAGDTRALTAAIDEVHRDATGARRRAIAATIRLANDHQREEWAARYDSVYDAAIIAAARRRPTVRATAPRVAPT